MAKLKLTAGGWYWIKPKGYPWLVGRCSEIVQNGGRSPSVFYFKTYSGFANPIDVARADAGPIRPLTTPDELTTVMMYAPAFDDSNDPDSKKLCGVDCGNMEFNPGDLDAPDECVPVTCTWTKAAHRIANTRFRGNLKEQLKETATDG